MCVYKYACMSVCVKPESEDNGMYRLSGSGEGNSGRLKRACVCVCVDRGSCSVLIVLSDCERAVSLKGPLRRE